jgi:hypothetical protein
VSPGAPPPKGRRARVSMSENVLKKVPRLGPKPKLFDWPWPGETKPKPLPGSDEDKAYWTSMSQPKRHLKPAWAKDPKGPEEQYW